MSRKVLLASLAVIAVGSVAWIVGRGGIRSASSTTTQPRPTEIEQAKSTDPVKGDPAPTAKEPSSVVEPLAPKDRVDTSKFKDDPVGTIFGIGQKAAKSLDTKLQKKYQLTDAEEIDAGQRIHRKVIDRLRTVPTAVPRLEALAKPIVDSRKRTQIPITITVVDRKEVNAFSHMGGYVYVFQGLLDQVGDDVELQFVLAHEIAHLDLGHCSEKAMVLARVGKVGGELFGEKTGDILGSIAQFGYAAIEAGYSEDKEFEADEWAYRKLIGMGKNRDDIVRFLHRLAKNDPAPRDPTGKKILDRIDQELSGHFRTHPASLDRIRRLEALPTQ